MKTQTTFIKVAALVALFSLFIGSSLTSSPRQAGALQATAAATAAATLPPAMAKPLIPCTGAAMACDMVATKAEDIAGVWKQFLQGPFFNAPNEMGYIRFNLDGTFYAADTIENSAKAFKNYPAGTFKFVGQLLTMPKVVNDNVPSEECSRETNLYQVRVMKYGDKPVALRFMPVHDDCIGRMMDYVQPLMWAAPLSK
jgi:hypothetical protein